ncbi:ParA family protein [Marinobacteraceae bacterium S3BR75-40.1]
MARIVAVTNQKGGVGKTTTCVNLSASLAATKRRVLLVDMDPQGNATMGSGVDKNALKTSGFDVLTKRRDAADVVVRVDDAGFDLLPANGDLTAAEVELMNEIGREHRLRLALKELRSQYDFILIDCPPSLNLLTVNALAAADSVLIPMQCEYYALEGLAALMNTIEQIQETVNPSLEIEGILRTMYDPRNSLTLDVSNQLSEFFGDKVYTAVIPRNVRLAEAPSYGLPALKYDRQSKGAIAYLALAGEIVRRTGAGKAAAVAV